MYVIEKFTGNVTNHTVLASGLTNDVVNEIYISNSSSVDLNIILNLERASTDYPLIKVTIPGLTSLNLNDKAFKFNFKEFALKLTTTGSCNSWAIIIT